MNSNQYLRPEDLPITDAKKSPLALLAQTCSNLGADLLGNSKPIRLGSNGDKPNRKSLMVDGDVNCNSRSDSASSDKTVQSCGGGPKSNQSTRSSSAASQPNSPNAAHTVLAATPVTITTSSSNNNSRISFKPYEISSSSATTKNSPSSNYHADRRSTQSDSRSNTNHSDLHSNSDKERIPSGSPKQRQPSASPAVESARSATSSALTFSSNGLDSMADSKANEHQKSVMNGQSSYHAALAEHEQLLKSSAHYAFMAQHHQNQLAAAAQMNASKQGPCSDPYCRGCQMALAGVPSNTPCYNQHPGFNPFNAAGLALGMQGLAGRGAGGYHPGLAAGAPGTSGRPFTCSWTAGGAYCGKMFNTSEELLQHLKSHTAAFSPAALSALGQYSHLDPMLTSPVAGLRRTAFDPINRYHPYKSFGPPSLSPLLGGPTGAGLAGLNPHAAASLGLHYPPPGAGYGPYASRIGPAVPP